MMDYVIYPYEDEEVPVNVLTDRDYDAGMQERLQVIDRYYN